MSGFGFLVLISLLIVFSCGLNRTPGQLELGLDDYVGDIDSEFERVKREQRADKSVGKIKENEDLENGKEIEQGDIAEKNAKGKENEKLKEADEEEEEEEENAKYREKSRRDPPGAFGFLTLEDNYDKHAAPNGESTEVKAWMEPTFVTEIDSAGRRMGLEMKMSLLWEDRRINWVKEQEMAPGKVFTLEPSILE